MEAEAQRYAKAEPATTTQPGAHNAGGVLRDTFAAAGDGFRESLRWLAELFRHPEQAAREYLRGNQGSALEMFLRLHLPVLVLYPVAGLLCPAVHLGLGRFSFTLQVVAPLVLVVGALAFAVLFDQVARFARHPEMETPENALRIKNLALFSHLPLSAAGIFFILHPLIGFLMVLIALAYSVWTAIDLTSIFFEVSRARVLVYLINAALLGVVPLAALTFLVNILRSLVFVKRLF